MQINLFSDSFLFLQDSCLPVSTFIWSIENESGEAKDVSLTFTFKNGTGGKRDGSKKCSTVSFQVPSHGVPIHGVALEQVIEGIDTTYGIGCLEKVNLLYFSYLKPLFCLIAKDHCICPRGFSSRM